MSDILQIYHPDGIQEVFEVFKVSASYPVRLECRSHLGEYTAMHFATGRVRRKNRTYWVWAEAVIFSKIDTYGSVRKPHLPGLVVKI